jgi:hypothetical protein
VLISDDTASIKSGSSEDEEEKIAALARKEWFNGINALLKDSMIYL